MVQEEQQVAVKPSQEGPNPKGDANAGRNDSGVTPFSDIGNPPSPAPSASPPPAGGSAADNGILNGEIEILPGRRLPHLDKGPVKAYAARTKGDNGSPPYFAMICEPQLIPRSRLGGAYASVINPNLVRLVASGTFYWPPAGANRYSFVYENTLGHPLIPAGETHGPEWRPDKIVDIFVRPMINILLDLRDSGVIHGDIRPANMFTGADQVADRIILGECLSTPTGYSQPVVFETIERAMCDPVARGKGSFSDDLYALGVSLVFLLRRKDPLHDMTDREIIEEKIKLGSYAALTGKDRFTGGILELLRGLLYDDSAQRWTLEEVTSWLDGQRLSPKQSSRKKKASRPFNFNDKRYSRPALLAMDLNDNPAEAVQVIENNQLMQWVNRSLEDSTTEMRLEQAIETAQEQGRGPGYWDRLLSRVSIALHPEAPIRYKHLKVHPEGLATALAGAIIGKQDVQPYADMISQQFILHWLHVQTNLQVDIGALATRGDACRAFLRQTNMGYGLERCLYYLDPEIPCLSERVLQYYIRAPEELMYALEDLSDRPGRPDLFVDRHIAAFLSVRDKKVIDAYLPDLNSDEYFKKVMGNVMVVATIQKRGRMETFPGLSRWVADILDPVYERYHDRELREQLKKKVVKLRDSGDLTKIAALLDNNETLQSDFAAYKKAMQEFQALRAENNQLREEIRDPETFGLETGKEIAAVISCALAGIVMLGLSFVYFAGGGF